MSGVASMKNVAWIAETRKRQELSQVKRATETDLTAGLFALWFREFAVEVEDIVRELNKIYPEKFDGALRIVPGPNIELQCGPNPVFEASIFNGTMLKVTRYERVGITGEMKVKPDHYVAQVESGKFLSFEWKDGSTILPIDMGKELFGFLAN